MVLKPGIVLRIVIATNYLLYKKIIRTIQNLEYNAHTNHYCSNFKYFCILLFYLEHRYEYKRLKMYGSQQWNSYHEPRNKDKLVVPLARKTWTQSVFFFQGINKWIGLLDELMNSKNSKLLRRKLKTNYLSRY